jgi:lipopolysaccharide transport system permease protein
LASHQDSGVLIFSRREAAQSMPAVPLKVISSEPSTLPQFVRAFIKYRHLLGLLIWRDMNVRYRQTAVGLIWVILQPVISALILTFIFGYLARLPADGVPYVVFAYSGAVLWRFFFQGVDRSSLSILMEEGLITKVYFPRWILPLTYIGGLFFDFLISLVILFVLVLATGLHPGWFVLLLPAAVVLVVLVAAFTGISVALLSCKYRDFTFLVSFALQIFQFVTPVFYSVSLFGPKMQILAYLNPLTGPFELFRLSVTGTSHFWLPGFLISLAGDLIVILIGCRVVYLLEDELVDVI